MATITEYQYSALLPGSNSTRLVRLLPNEDETAPLKCELFNCTLPDSKRGTHPYDALSYVWGGSNKPRSIFIDYQRLAITENLHAALLQLRDTFLPRILWIDAICINQGDIKERGYQVRFMGKVYSKASRVIVWLGEAANNSDQALEEIRVAFEQQSRSKSAPSEKIQEAVLTLLQRPWFRRIWVLQEVAMARHVLIICGFTEIEGYTFCLGLKSLNISYKNDPGLENVVHSVRYLIRGANSRPRQVMNQPTSTHIGLLGELIDTYRAHEATERHDKVYALLGMSSDNPSMSGIIPDYTISWEQLFRQLVHYLFSERAYVKVLNGAEMAIIRSKGCIFGRVRWVSRNRNWGDTQIVKIVSEDASRSFGAMGWESSWNLLISVAPIRSGDLVCVLLGASNPIIIRTFKDYFAVVTASVNPEKGVYTVSRNYQSSGHPIHITWPELLRTMRVFNNDLLLIWDWEKLPMSLKAGTEYQTLMKENDKVSGQTKTDSENDLERLIRIEKVTQIFAHTKKYEKAEDGFREVLSGYKKILGINHTDTLRCMKNLAIVHWHQEQPEEAEELLVQVIEARKKVSGIFDSDKPSSLAALSSIFTEPYYDEPGVLPNPTLNLQTATRILETRDENVEILEDEMVEIASCCSEKTIMFLLERRGSDAQISEKLLEGAAKNITDGVKVTNFLLNRIGLRPTAKALQAAVSNWNYGKEIVTLLLDGVGDNILVTEEVLEAAAGSPPPSYGKEMVSLLLDGGGEHIHITENVLIAAARNDFYGREIINLLIERGGEHIQITEKILIAAAGNDSYGREIMTLLIEREGGNIQVTDELLVAAIQNKFCVEELLSLLLERARNHVQITEEVLEAAGWNRKHWSELMLLLLEEKSCDELQASQSKNFILASVSDNEVGVRTGAGAKFVSSRKRLRY